MELKDGELVFISGKMLGANHNLVSINPRLEIAEGYDGFISRLIDNSLLVEHVELTREEKIELADYMISLWSQYRSLQNPDSAPEFPPATPQHLRTGGFR